MKKLRKTITLYFSLSRKESNGFFILCGLLLLLIFAPSIYRSYPKEKEKLFPSDIKTLDSLVTLLDVSSNTAYTKKNHTTYKKNQNSFSPFNPNNSSEEEMNDAGVPKFISARIIKFRNKGGKFKKAEDLKKIYGLTESTFNSLSPFIVLTTEKQNTQFQYPERKVKEIKRLYFDLNKIDSSQLVSLRGIGPAFASRIIKYKKKLGGFISQEQLKEVYGLDSFALKEVITHTSIESDFIPNQLNLNSATLNELANHPYVGRKNGQLILNFIKQHGKFNSVESIKNIKSITEENYQKILPYIKAE